MYLIFRNQYWLSPAIHYVAVRPTACCLGGTGTGLPVQGYRYRVVKICIADKEFI
jgi:hypothetical protein